jgi:hypothetical protein
VDHGGISICDSIEGAGTHVVETFLHFHPDVRIHECPGGRLPEIPSDFPSQLKDARSSTWGWQARTGSSGFVVALWPQSCSLRVEKLCRTFAPRHSVEFDSSSLCLVGAVPLPVHLAWVILTEEGAVG